MKITQHSTETTMERKLEVVILRNNEDLFSLREGEFIGTSEGYCYRSSDEKVISFIGRFNHPKPIKLIPTLSSYIIRNGILIYQGCKKQMNYDEITRAEENLRALGI